MSDLKTQISRLTTLAAQLVTRRNMMSECSGDYNFSKSTTKRDIEKVVSGAATANNQCRVWGIEIRSIADAISKIDQQKRALKLKAENERLKLWVNIFEDLLSKEIIKIARNKFFDKQKALEGK